MHWKCFAKTTGKSESRHFLKKKLKTPETINLESKILINIYKNGA